MLEKMNSMERVLKALSHQEPDRVPVFLLLSLYGAKEMQMTPKEYFSDPQNVVKAQLMMQKKYNNDCLDSFYYAGIEIEAWGGTTIFKKEGPPVTGKPIITTNADIDKLTLPDIESSESLQKVLTTIRMLKEEAKESIPILGVVIAPYSLAIMQMGFDRYMELLYSDDQRFWKLMSLNEKFCIEWANRQLKAGATAIAYFDPMSSPTMVPKHVFMETGYKIATRTINQINGPVATHFASGICIPIIDEIVSTGAVAVGVSCKEDLEILKKKTKDKITILGNLNGIEMRRWTASDTERIVKDLIRKAGKGGGLIISDNHGEIPWQVPEDVLHEIVTSIKKWGTYPLEWIDDYEE